MSGSWGQVLGDAAEQTARQNYREGLLRQQRAEELREQHEREDAAQEARYWTGEESRTRANLRRDEERRAVRERDRGVER